MWARKVEFIESARQLGVDKIYIVDEGQGIDDSLAYDDYEYMVARIEAVILSFETLYPGSSHKLISGRLERNIDGLRHPTHMASWDAAHNLRAQITDFRFYRCYEYTQESPTAERVVHLDALWFEAKRRALQEYMFFDPSHGRFALGYHSVQGLIDAAFNDPREYMDRLRN